MGTFLNISCFPYLVTFHRKGEDTSPSSVYQGNRLRQRQWSRHTGRVLSGTHISVYIRTCTYTYTRESVYTITVTKFEVVDIYS